MLGMLSSTYTARGMNFSPSMHPSLAVVGTIHLIAEQHHVLVVTMLEHLTDELLAL